MFTKLPLIELQTKVYLAFCIRHKRECGTYNFWIKEFLKTFNGSAEDIKQEDIDEFLTDIACLYGGQHQLDQARKAVEGLRRYYVARSRHLV